jgi:alpha-beta hydrolase superfamily lysophospholipase
MTALLALATLGGCATLDHQQRKWIFQPAKQTWWAGEAAAAGMQDVWIAFDSQVSGEPVRLHGLWHPGDQADAPVLLYLHGARWDVTGSAQRVRRMQSLGFSVLAIDYRGFGRSTEALPSEASTYEDAAQAWAWLQQHHGDKPRYLFGHSLGSAVAVHLASEVRDARGLIVEGSFTSIPDVFKTLRFGWLPIEGLITQRFDAGERIARVQVPVLVVHGTNDQLIRPELGRALYERAPAPKRFELVEGGSHHSTNAVGQSQYRAALRALFGLG